MARKKKGYTEKLVNGKRYYFSEYSSFSTPHLKKIEAHVAKKRAPLGAAKAAKAAKKKVIQKSSTSKAKAPAGASSSTPTIDKE